jgi:hypothetical protein
MSAANVEGDDVGDGIFAGESLDERRDADTLAGFEAISPVNQDSTSAITIPKENRDGLAVLLDVLAKRDEFIIRHHREHVGGGMDLIFVAPAH